MINDGSEPAFPIDIDRPGMTLRDYYIGQVLAGLCADSKGNTWENIGVCAVEAADMALAAREEQPNAN